MPEIQRCREVGILVVACHEKLDTVTGTKPASRDNERNPIPDNRTDRHSFKTLAGQHRRTRMTLLLIDFTQACAQKSGRHVLCLARRIDVL